MTDSAPTLRVSQTETLGDIAEEEEVAEEREVRSYEDLSALTQQASILAEEEADATSSSCSTSSVSVSAADGLLQPAPRQRVRTRSRIRQRASEWKDPRLTELQKSGPVADVDGDETLLVGEEEKLIHLQYDDVVTAEEAA
eukprot:Gregarina_sp_Pseudo_9__5767@NODE_855_length_2130_cov_5_601148_g803_i0_p2_GENE_NODE_855_length_2130_cov_5_601148_g803_i0NODE_855_length_2130_cov_5_601148_g803_i0_p2_ORF_typecomplete_len141_score43_98_NODE_855_length_2130_cov_5_601148_g803_i016642086